jgi:GNAT superfamily N-acetyltransferase
VRDDRDNAVPGQVTIRPAEDADSPQLAGLLTQLGYPVTAKTVRQRMAYWRSGPMSRIMVAETGGQVVGLVSLHAIPYLERTGRWLRIESLVVDENVRGQGVGRALVAVAESAAREWDCLAIEVTSARSRAGAHAFYGGLGYVDVCDRSGRFFKVLSNGGRPVG